MSVCKRSKDGQIFVNWQEGGKEKRKYFGKGAQAMAEAVRFNETITKPRERQTHGPTFAELVNAYMLAKVSSMPKASMDNLLWKMKRVILPELGHRLAMTLDHLTLDRYVAKRSASVKNTTIHRELSDVRAVLNFAVRRRMLQISPMAGYEMPVRDDATILPLSQPEIEAIIAHSPDHLRRAMLLSFFCGLRPGAVELLSIKYSQINWHAGSITIISARKGGAKKREIPIHDALPLREWYEADGADPERHIITWHGKPVQKISRSFTRVKKSAGVGGRKIPMYALRHAFVSTLLHQGVNPRDIADMTGHDVRTLLKHYAHSMTEHRKTAIAKLPTLKLHPLGAEKEKAAKKATLKRLK